MSLRTQSGFTLLETIVAMAIVAVSLGASFYALTSFGRHAAWQMAPQRRAALLLARQTLRVAENAWKYGSPGSAPAGTQGGVTTSVSVSGSSATLAVTVRYSPEPGGRDDTGVVTVSGEVTQKSPLPGSQIDRPGFVPLPSGAP